MMGSTHRWARRSNRNGPAWDGVAFEFDELLNDMFHRFRAKCAFLILKWAAYFSHFKYSGSECN